MDRKKWKQNDQWRKTVIGDGPALCNTLKVKVHMYAYTGREHRTPLLLFETKISTIEKLTGKYELEMESIPIAWLNVLVRKCEEELSFTC